MYANSFIPAPPALHPETRTPPQECHIAGVASVQFQWSRVQNTLRMPRTMPPIPSHPRRPDLTSSRQTSVMADHSHHLPRRHQCHGRLQRRHAAEALAALRLMRQPPGAVPPDAATCWRRGLSGHRSVAPVAATSAHGAVARDPPCLHPRARRHTRPTCMRYAPCPHLRLPEEMHELYSYPTSCTLTQVGLHRLGYLA